MRLFIGLMSGTSMDGIDAALVEGNTNRLIAGITRPYSDMAKSWLREVLAEKTELSKISQLNTVIGREFALAVNDLLEAANVSSREVTAIGSHGQTLCHDALADIPYTLQVGCGHTIAEMTKLPVIADFRTRDVVVGGQGAPFAPIYHQALFNQHEYPLAIINIGGIANVTYLTGKDAAVGYDIGPGNCLMDLWIQKQLNKSYDVCGQWARSGSSIDSLLTSLLEDPYFSFPFPKSIGKEYFSYEWLTKHLQSSFAHNDVQATLLDLTVHTIKSALESSQLNLNYVLLCGGGAHNTALLETLRRQMPHLMISSTEIMGVDPDFIEAMMFAWLAEKTMNNIPVDLSKITGAKAPAILGVLYPPPADISRLKD
jgi:anhydro-N-acetylmuramic acid kinase